MGGGARIFFVLLMYVVVMFDLVVLGIYLMKQIGKK